MFEAVCSDLTSEGLGVVRNGAFVVFVEGLLIGEKAVIRIEKREKRFAYGSVVRILERNPDRISPVCPHFGTCGGCSLMHLAYEKQLEWKRSQVITALRKLAHIPHPNVDATVGLEPLHYRNKLQMKATTVHGETRFGLYKKGSNEIVPIDTCYIQEEAGDLVRRAAEKIASQCKAELRHILVRTSGSGKALVVLIAQSEITEAIRETARHLFTLDSVVGVHFMQNTKRENVILGEEVIPLFGELTLEEKMLGMDFKLDPKAFFQINRPVAERMYRHAFEMSSLQSGMRALDAYAGSGIFARFLAGRGVRVTAIEIVPEAQVQHCGVTWIVGAVEKEIDRLGTFDVVFLNPPRKGCEKTVLESLIRKNAARIVYTSCNPQTLARDIAILGYTLVGAAPFDLFPQTTHVETVALLAKK
ncbi:MAG: 23S rRNA (uracil-5-)-methyltransferase RumA [Chlamydiae bacterium RIFCSPHIGHO2_12_FULL_49_11]|nr:MAG: 23S rRNA (uracil-5-)-methyltransferase RumA [Chlamydiae bacterium RIFCSPHIGHO2_12_FULL_49_11]